MIHSYKAVERGVVEGISTNVAIPCDLFGFSGALYWRIEGLTYDLYSIPGFIVDGYASITLPTVDRRVNNYTFQCLALDNSSENGMRVGVRVGGITRLHVMSPNASIGGFYNESL